MLMYFTLPIKGLTVGSGILLMNHGGINYLITDMGWSETQNYIRVIPKKCNVKTNNTNAQNLSMTAPVIF